MKKALLVVLTGDGKGKTTSALGQALRAVGHGMRVGFFQFFKERISGEHNSAIRLIPLLEICRLGRGFIIRKKDELPRRACEEALKQWNIVKPLILHSDYDMIVLDELNFLLSKRLLPLEEVIGTLSKRNPDCHLIVTGRGAPEELIEIADIVTEMKEIKHCFSDGLSAQRGIEF